MLDLRDVISLRKTLCFSNVAYQKICLPFIWDHRNRLFSDILKTAVTSRTILYIMGNLYYFHFVSKFFLQLTSKDIGVVFAITDTLFKLLFMNQESFPIIMSESNTEAARGSVL